MIVLLAMAATAAQPCPVVPGWANPVAHRAARVPAMRFALKAGTAARLGLSPTRDVTLVANGRRREARSLAGLAAIDVARAGKLDVVLSNASYVDLIRGGKPLTSVAHRTTTGCTGMRKSVTFDVVPGRYLVQLTEAPAASITIGTVLR